MLVQFRKLLLPLLGELAVYRDLSLLQPQPASQHEQVWMVWVWPDLHDWQMSETKDTPSTFAHDDSGTSCLLVQAPLQQGRGQGRETQGSSCVKGSMGLRVSGLGFQGRT